MQKQSKRILVTGLSGLIGKELIEPLLKENYEIFAVSRTEQNSPWPVHWIVGDIFDSAFVRHACETAKAEYLINMAWIVTKDYAFSNLNFSFLSAGINLIQEFKKNGGKKAFYAGSCSEYKDKDTPIAEQDELAPDKNLYAFCKIKLSEIVRKYCEQNQISFVYGRIFNIYGHNEEEKRLSSQIIRACLTDTQAVIKSGPLYKDYMYSKDAAQAIVHLLSEKNEGTFNICSGNPVTIREFALTLAEQFGKKDLLVFKDDFGSQAPYNCGNNQKLLQTGFRPGHTLEQGLKELTEKALSSPIC